MAISDVSSKSFANELMRLSLSIIWKDQGKATAAEDDDNRMEAEAYIAARRGELNFNSVHDFHTEVLQTFFPSPDELEVVVMDKKQIPEVLRPSIVAAEQDFIIDYWENQDGEKNSYYRKLFGLPPIDIAPKDLVYNTKYANFPMDIPVHMMSYSDRLKLEKMGYLEELVNAVDDHSRDYLKYCGARRIYPYVSRQAEPFELLYMAESTVKQLRNDFIDVFEAARRMMVRVYYNDAYRNKTELYDGFLALCILFMAQQRICSKYIETNISRDFYDLDSLRVLYDAYGVPFYSEIPLTYHTKIVKRLNELLSYKGSTQVFYDLFSIFDFGTMDVFEYFLVKRRLIDVNGNPIFRDIYGKPLSERDMWKIRFARIAWKDDKFVEVTNPDNIIDYEELTVPDPYWVEDEQLKEKLYGRDWNYFHSKYLGVQIMFDLTELIFQSCYFLRMLEDNRGTTEEIHCYYMVTGTDVPLYDMVIYAIALLCKNAGYTGEIPADPSSISAVYGFNFKEYMEILKLVDCDTGTFVINLKQAIYDFIQQNDVLSNDEALLYWVDQVTEGAFSYLGDDFPYGEPHKAPPPLFIHDFVPTRNSIHNLKNYLSATIDQLNKNGEDDELIDAELYALYQRLQFQEGGPLLEVKHRSSAGMNSIYHAFFLAREKWTDEQREEIHKAILASYTQLLSMIIKRIQVREAIILDPHILTLIQDMDIYNLKDVDEVYNHIDELDTYLTYAMQNCHDKRAYNAYYNVRKIFMTTRLMNETFAKKNGTVAKTYADLLAEVNPMLYRRLTSEETDCDQEEQYVIQTLMNLCDKLTLLQAINTDNIQRIINYLMKILMFLKSAKVDLVDFEIIYLISDRSANYLKLLSQIWAQDVEDGHLKDYLWLLDEIHFVKVLQWLDDTLWFTDPNLGQQIIQVLKDKFNLLTDEGRNNLMMEVEIAAKDDFQYWLAEISDWIVKHEIVEPLTLLEHWYTYIKQRLPSQFFTLSDEVLLPPDTLEDIAVKDFIKFLVDHQLAEVEQALPSDTIRLKWFNQAIDIEYELRRFLKFQMQYRAIELEQQLRDQVLGQVEKHYFETHMGAMDYMCLREKGNHYARVEYEPSTDTILWGERITKIIEPAD